MANKKIHIFGGGTFFDISSHFALAAPAFGQTARQLDEILRHWRTAHHFDVELHLTQMAGGQGMRTNSAVARWVDEIVSEPTTKIVFFNVAMCDFEAYWPNGDEIGWEQPRPSSDGGEHRLYLRPAEKIIRRIRAKRKDIFLVGFKSTAGLPVDVQYIEGLELLKKASCNLVLANDSVTRTNMVVTPEEARYHVTTDRQEALYRLVDMALLRSHLTFTRSTVVAGEPVPWSDERVPQNLRTVVNWCIEQGAYKPFRGATVGHFAVKLSDTEFLTSRRKTNFNQLPEVGLVRVKTDGPDTVIAYGSKPSVGGQSQRLVFSEHAGMDCIVHFHCPLLNSPADEIPVVSQREYECGSHECGQNTSKGLRSFGELKCVMLDNHGPNIVFPRTLEPEKVIDFIRRNFALDAKTGGYVDLSQVPLGQRTLDESTHAEYEESQP